MNHQVNPFLQSKFKNVYDVNVLYLACQDKKTLVNFEFPRKAEGHEKIPNSMGFWPFFDVIGLFLPNVIGNDHKGTVAQIASFGLIFA